MKKMKNFKYMAWSGVAILLTALSFTACIDGNDWDVDSSYDRLFSVQKLSVSAAETEATVTWTGTVETEYYIIEISRDSLYDAIPLNGTETSKVYGEDKSITRSPYTIPNLDSATEYFIRIKGMSTVKEDSKWFYLEDASFKTKSEQIIESVVPGITTAVVNWTPGATVTRLTVYEGSETTGGIPYPLSEADIAAGTYTIEGLQPNTTYRVNLVNETAVRGTYTFTTAMDIPDADLQLFLYAGDILDQDYLDREIDPAQHSTVTIAFEENAEFYNSSSITLPDGVSFNFYGMPGENKPRLAINGMTMGSNHEFISFQNLEIAGKGTTKDGVAFSFQYFFNQGASTEVGELKFIDCEICDFSNSPIRLKDATAKAIQQLTIENCFIKGWETRGYSLIHIDAGSGVGKINNISVDKSTIWYTGKSFIYSNKTDMNEISITNCTFSKAPGAEDYIIDFGSANGAERIIFDSNILGSITGEKSKGYRGTGTMNTTNSYYTLDWAEATNKPNGLIEYEGTEAQLFADPENGDFTIIDSSFEGRRSAGDPRWYMP